jgi:hypothetical protein
LVAWVVTLPYWMHLQQVTPGGTARVVAAELKADFNPNISLWPRVTADGKKFLFVGTEGIVEVREDGHHRYLQKSKDITYKGEHPSRDYLWGLAIDATGDHWAAVTSFLPPKAKDPIYTVVRGSASGRLEFHEEKDRLSFVSMSGDGRSVLMQRESQRTPNVQLWRDGSVRPIRPDFLDFRYAILSGDGNTLYAENQLLGTGHSGDTVLENLTTGQRRRVMTKTIGYTSQGHVRLSRDGKVLASYSPTGTGWQNGLYLFHADAALSALHPKIKSVRQRYDGGKLVITAEVEAPEGLAEIAILGLKNGYLNPSGLVPEGQNPLRWINYSRFAEVPKRPGIFQHTIDLGTGHAFLDGSYSFRIIAVNADRTRTTFQEYAVLR